MSEPLLVQRVEAKRGAGGSEGGSAWSGLVTLICSCAGVRLQRYASPHSTAQWLSFRGPSHNIALDLANLSSAGGGAGVTVRVLSCWGGARHSNHDHHRSTQRSHAEAARRLNGQTPGRNGGHLLFVRTASPAAIGQALGYSHGRCHLPAAVRLVGGVLSTFGPKPP